MPIIPNEKVAVLLTFPVGVSKAEVEQLMRDFHDQLLPVEAKRPVMRFKTFYPDQGDVCIYQP
jgi:hypothetical protein